MQSVGRRLVAEFSCIVVCIEMESNKNSCVEEEIVEQSDQSGAHRLAKRDRVRRRRSCETEQQTVARRDADRSRSKRRRTTETSQ